MSAYSWAPTAGPCVCPDYAIRRAIRHTPWRAASSFLCQCATVWVCHALDDDLDGAEVEAPCAACQLGGGLPCSDHLAEALLDTLRAQP